MDNITKNGMEYHLTPSQIHIRNITERAIQTFKNHFITILAGSHSKFPENERERLIPGAELTLNSLTISRINPRLSPEQQLNGTFHSNTTSQAPPGTKTLSYEMPTHRAIGEENGEEG